MTEKKNQNVEVAQTKPKIEKEKVAKTLTAVGLAAMAFSGVWSFGNITNGFGYFNGTAVILPLLAVFILYFLPYSLIVGELGSVFKNHDGGVSVWIFKTVGPFVAFVCGWIYWVVHMPYLSQKPSQLVVSLNWLFRQNGSISDMPVLQLCVICLFIFLIAAFLSAQGMSMVKKITGLAGGAMFVMMILYIILIFAAPTIRGTGYRSFTLSWDSIMPKDWSFIFNMSILIFSVGGCEKFAPYVKTMKNPGRGFPLGMIFLVIMVVVTAILGTIAMNCVYDGNKLPSDFFTNAQYQAFAMLGEFYGIDNLPLVGNLSLMLYSLANALCLFGAIIVSIDAPLRILLGNADRNYIPAWWFKKNRKGSYTNGIKVVTIIVSILIMIPAIGIGDVEQLMKWLIKLNSVCMPLRYAFVFVAYFALKAAMNKFKNEDYTFIKNPTLGKITAIWCLLITLVSCIMGMRSENAFEFIMNVCTPFVLIGIGLLLPQFVKYRKNHPAKKEVKVATPIEEYTTNFDTKELVLYCVFSIITLGIYNFYWIYKITKTLNIIAYPKDKTNPGFVVLFSILTLGLYNIYWSYKEAKVLRIYYESLQLPIAKHATVGYPIVAATQYINWFSTIIILSLLQNHINNIVEQELL